MNHSKSGTGKVWDVRNQVQCDHVTSKKEEYFMKSGKSRYYVMKLVSIHRLNILTANKKTVLVWMSSNVGEGANYRFPEEKEIIFVAAKWDSYWKHFELNMACERQIPDISTRVNEK